MGIRTTITLDEDVYERLKEESKSSGISFRQTVNRTIRIGLVAKKSMPPAVPFKIETYPLGVRPGVPYDSTEQMLELAEGELHR